MDYKLKVFKEVALNKSFSQAAKKLNLSQPAVSKIVKNLEEKYGKAFFERKANNIELTPDGIIFLRYAEKLLNIYKEMSDEFFDNTQPINEEIKIGASTTIANYIIPKLIALLQVTYPSLKINLIAGNTNEIQGLILKKKLDIGIVEGENHNTRLHYEKFVQDELVLVTNGKSFSEKNKNLSIEDLKLLPIISREVGSGTREVIENALKNHQVETSNIHSVFGSTEGIKTYLLHSNDFAFLSIHSIVQELLENRLRLIEIEDFQINRWFYFITRQGYQSKLALKLKKMLLNVYNQR